LQDCDDNKCTSLFEVETKHLALYSLFIFTQTKNDKYNGQTSYAYWSRKKILWM